MKTTTKPTCHACGTAADVLEALTIQGNAVLACQRPGPCIARAKAAGVWCR